MRNYWQPLNQRALNKGPNTELRPQGTSSFLYTCMDTGSLCLCVCVCEHFLKSTMKQMLKDCEKSPIQLNFKL